MHARALWQLTTKLHEPHVQYKIWHDALIAWALLASVQRMFPLHALLTATYTRE